MPYTSPQSTEPLERATRVRYGVLGFACVLSMITYLDRVCFSSGQTDLIRDLGLKTEADLKWAFTAFALAYALFEVPSGWLGDVFGPRKVLIRIVLWWSAFTAITGLVGYWAWSGWTFTVGPWTLTFGWMAVLVMVRFLFGMGEAGAYPNITRALHNWFPLQERGFAQGCVWMSGRLAGGLTPIIWALLVAGIATTVTTEAGEKITQTIVAPLFSSWRHAFWFFGIVGIVWCVLFYLWFRNRPEEKSTVNAEELKWIRSGAVGTEAAHKGIPWRKLLRSRNLWLLCLMYACQAYPWYFYITYLPKFLEEHHGVSPTSLLGAVYKGGPLWLGACGCLLGGILTDLYIRRTGNRRMGRKLFGMVGHAATGACFLVAPWAPTAFTFFLAIALAGFFTDLTMGPAWATCQDIGRRYSAIVAGFMNMVGNAGGALASFLSGAILEWSTASHAQQLGVEVGSLSPAEALAGRLSGYHVNFAVFASVCVVSVLCWSLIDASKPVVDD